MTHPNIIIDQLLDELGRWRKQAHAAGERVIYSTLILAASILTLGATSALVRKINK